MLTGCMRGSMQNEPSYNVGIIGLGTIQKTLLEMEAFTIRWRGRPQFDYLQRDTQILPNTIKLSRKLKVLK